MARRGSTCANRVRPGNRPVRPNWAIRRPASLPGAYRARRLKLPRKAFKIRPARPDVPAGAGVPAWPCSACTALETVMGNVNEGLSALADHLQARRGNILQAWRHAIDRDPTLTTSEALPRVELYDHIPALLSIFEHQLRAGAAMPDDGIGHAPAAAHGLQRWQQGYDLREVTRELGKLNEIVVSELEAYRFADLGPARE